MSGYLAMWLEGLLIAGLGVLGNAITAAVFYGRLTERVANLKEDVLEVKGDMKKLSGDVQKLDVRVTKLEAQ